MPATVPDHAAAQEAAALVAARARTRFNLVALLRLVCFVILALAVAALVRGAETRLLAVLTAAGSLAAFLGLAMWHGAIDDRRRRADALAAYHKRGRERVAGTFAHGQDDGAGLLPAGHPFAADLDLVGPDGLYARLNTAGSPAGRRVLADWLFAARAEDGRARSHIVQSWAEAHGWRAEIAVLAGDESDRASGADELGEWLRGDPQRSAWAGWLPLVWALRILVSVLVVGAGIVLSLDTAVLTALALGILLVPLERVAVARAPIGPADQARRRIAAQAAALSRLAQAPGDHADLDDLRQRAAAAAEALGRLAGILEAHAKRGNALWLILAALWLVEWRNLALLQAWADEHGGQYDRYLDTLGEGEALSCLATYAAEQGGTWAEVVADGPMLEVTDLAHPLLPPASRVGNGVSLDDGQVLLLTGANASGKSTFIRSLALAIVMTRLGLPLPAARCRLRPMRLATVMRVTDDLRGGRSRFQAEVERLRDMVQLMDDGGAPVCLALDEILGGTNSLERHHGTRAVLDHARGGHGIVLVSTHDLELADLAAAEPERFVLAHFADRAALGEVDDTGDMVFDYQLRPGVLQSTNALRVMRHYGLPVPEAVAEQRR